MATLGAMVQSSGRGHLNTLATLLILLGTAQGGPHHLLPDDTISNLPPGSEEWGLEVQGSELVPHRCLLSTILHLMTPPPMLPPPHPHPPFPCPSLRQPPTSFHELGEPLYSSGEGGLGEQRRGEERWREGVEEGRGWGEDGWEGAG